MILLADVTMDPMLALFLFIILPFYLFILFLRIFDDIKNLPEKIRCYRNKISSFIHNPRILVPEKNLKFITLFAAVVKCDGRVRHKEIEFVKKHIFLSSRFNKYREESIRFFDSEIEDINVRFIGYKTTNVPFFMLDRKNIVGKSISERVSDISANLFSKYLKKYVDRMEFMDILFQIAYSQAGVSDEEVNLLREVAYSLYIRSWDFTSLLYKYEYIKEEDEKQQKKEQKRTDNTGKKNRAENEKNEQKKTSENRFKSVAKTRKMEALQLLEITEGADEQEIKSAYRRMAKKYHPDTLPANVSEEEKEEAAARFRSIHEAYDFLLSLEMVRAN